MDWKGWEGEGESYAFGGWEGEYCGGWGEDRRRDATWKVCLDTAGGHPQAEALNFPLIYTFY